MILTEYPQPLIGCKNTITGPLSQPIAQLQTMLEHHHYRVIVQSWELNPL
jgi:hypothetical protein